MIPPPLCTPSGRPPKARVEGGALVRGALVGRLWDPPPQRQLSKAPTVLRDAGGRGPAFVGRRRDDSTHCFQPPLPHQGVTGREESSSPGLNPSATPARTDAQFHSWVTPGSGEQSCSVRRKAAFCFRKAEGCLQANTEHPTGAPSSARDCWQGGVFASAPRRRVARTPPPGQGPFTKSV